MVFGLQMGSEEGRCQRQQARDRFPRGCHCASPVTAWKHAFHYLSPSVLPGQVRRFNEPFQAGTVLDDSFSTTFPDTDHSSSESRFITIGMSGRRRILVVVHSEDTAGMIRIISARRATNHERV